jgi:hypothetical protein
MVVSCDAVWGIYQRTMSHPSLALAMAEKYGAPV